MSDIVERLRNRDAVVMAGLHHAIPAMRDAAAEIEKLREALFTILANTKEGAIKHRSYDDLAKDIADCARAVLPQNYVPQVLA